MDSVNDIVGGKWWKFDFHIHTPGSYDYGNGQPDEAAQKATTPEELLRCCMEKELDCIVVSDHNTFEWISKLKLALNVLRNENAPGFRELTLFPACEVSTQGNVHLLTVFDPSVNEDILNQVFGQFAYDDLIKATSKSLHDVMQIVVKNKGIAIPAHVDKANGLFGAAASEIRGALVETGILALEVTEPTVTNQLYIESKLHLAHVLGSDSHCIRTIASHYTWVKMGRPNIEALRLALFDAEDGVIRDIDFPGNPNEIHRRTFIKSMTIENGKYIGRGSAYSISFSPWLTNMIGGRGSGKSTVLKFIRLILGKESELPEALVKEFADFATVPQKRGDLGMLLSDEGTKTKVTMTIVVDGVEYVLMWQNGVTMEYMTETGEWQEAVALNNRFPVRMFSQKQLYEMTSDPELLFKYLDALWDSEKWKDEVNQIKEEYFSTRREIRALEQTQEKKSSLKAQLRDAEAKIAVFETERTKSVLLEKDSLEKNKTLIKAIYDSYQPLISLVEEFNLLPELQEWDNLSSLDDETKNSIMQWMESLTALRREMRVIVSKYSTQSLPFENLFSTLKLKNLIDKNSVEMEQIISELRASGVDGIDKYASLLAEKEQYSKALQATENVDNTLQKCREKEGRLIEELSEYLEKRIEERKSIIDSWNNIGQLRVTLCPMANLTKNAESFRGIIRKETEFSTDILEFEDDEKTPVKGLISKIIASATVNDRIEALKAIKQSVIQADPSEYSKRFVNYLTRLFSEYPESADEMSVWMPEDKIELEFNVNPHGQANYRTIDAGSPGQRTSAILSLIFGISNMPIIIDQPEDDLDTRNITDIVVNGIKEIKKNQQVILVTHNPNIVVNASSEQVVQLDYFNGQICNACNGALQDHDVRDAICTVMEGGKDALEKRYYRIFKALES